eukprot:890848-Pyramimonas_sp.AAC.1
MYSARSTSAWMPSDDSHVYHLGCHQSGPTPSACLEQPGRFPEPICRDSDQWRGVNSSFPRSGVLSSAASPMRGP